MPFEVGKNDFVFYNLLGLWESAWHDANYLRTIGQKKIVVATSFYDGGYSLNIAFEECLAGSNLEIEQRYIFPQRTPDTEAGLFAAGMKGVNPDVMFAVFSRAACREFLTMASEVNFFQKYNVMGSTLVAHASICEEFGEMLLGFQTIGSWVPSSKLVAN
jgi:hypothetical protein